MAKSTSNIQSVLAAANSLLQAREDGMLTSEEWERLARAVEDAENPVPPSAKALFAYSDKSGLTRAVVGPAGKVVVRDRADPETFAAVTEYAQCQRRAILIDEAREELGVQGRGPVAAVLEFLAENGLLERSGLYYASATGTEFMENAVAAARALPRRIAEGRR
jgi:hypothetical protein